MAAKRKHSDPDIVLNSSRNKRVHAMSSTDDQHSNPSILSQGLEDVSTQETIKDPSNVDVKLYMVAGDMGPDTLIPTINQREVTTASATAVTQDMFRGQTALIESNETRKKSIKNKAGDIAAMETLKEMAPTPQLKFRPPILDNALLIELHRKVHELRMKEWEDIDVGVEDTFSDARPRHHSSGFPLDDECQQVVDLEYTGYKIYGNGGNFSEPYDPDPDYEVLQLWPSPIITIPTTSLNTLLEADNETVVKSEFTNTILYDLPMPRRVDIDNCNGKLIDTWLRAGFDMTRDIIPRVRGMHRKNTRSETISSLRETLKMRRERYRDSVHGGLSENFRPKSQSFKAIMKPKGKKVLTGDQLLLGTRHLIDLEAKTFTFRKRIYPLSRPQEIPAEGKEGLEHLKTKIPDLKKFLKQNPSFRKYDPKDHPLWTKEMEMEAAESVTTKWKNRKVTQSTRMEETALTSSLIVKLRISQRKLQLIVD